jgi:hypothetical protein
LLHGLRVVQLRGLQADLRVLEGRGVLGGVLDLDAKSSQPATLPFCAFASAADTAPKSLPDPAEMSIAKAASFCALPTSWVAAESFASAGRRSSSATP